MSETIQRAALALREAQRTKQAVEPLTTSFPGLTVEEAYQIQALNLGLRLEAGERRVGHKIGLTSEAIQAWLKVNEPDFGGLLSGMMVPDGGELSLGKLLQPRAEGELVFVLGEPLEGPGVTAAQVLRATEFVLPSIEIIDSRVKDWKISLVDTVADNASSAMCVVGSTPVPVGRWDLRLVGMALRRNGRVVSTGAGAACLGNPAEAVAWLANRLSAFGQRLEAGQMILSGALGPAVEMAVGDFWEVQVGDEARASFRVVA